MLMERAWWLLFVAFNACTLYYDMRWRRVPNTLVSTAVVLEAGWLVAVATGTATPKIPGAIEWSNALMGFGIGAVFIVFWKLRVFGAGDVKYLAALGLMLGVRPLLGVLIFGSIIGGVHAAGQVWRLKRYGRAGQSKRGVPYAGYMAIVALIMVLMPLSSPSFF